MRIVKLFEGRSPIPHKKGFTLLHDVRPGRGKLYRLGQYNGSAPMACAGHLLFNAVNHLILVASQLIFEKTAWEICVSDLPLCEKAGHSQNLRVFIFRGIVLRGEHRIVELRVGDLMHQGSDGLNLAHALADAYFLAFGVESAVSVRGHFFKRHRNR